MWERHGYISCCSQCGSVHPLDVYRALREGNIRLRGARWEGWPHKFYIYPVGIAGFDGKLYSQHLLDLDEEQFDQFVALLLAHTGIRFSIQDGRLIYQAPYRSINDEWVHALSLSQRRDAGVRAGDCSH